MRRKKMRGSLARRLAPGVAALAGALTLAACASSAALPQTRTLVTMTGERVEADPEFMVEVDSWLRPQLFDIEARQDQIRLLQSDGIGYPWDTMELLTDTVEVAVQRGQGDAETPYLIYAHFRLMDELGELEAWLPEAFPEEGPPAEGVELERMILRRVAQVWLLGRSVFDTTPYGPLDELLFANQSGFLEEFLLTTQPDRFEAEARAHFEANPGRAEAYEAWFERVFERSGPGFLPAGEGVAEPA